MWIAESQKRSAKGSRKTTGLCPSRCYYSLAKRNGILFGLAIINRLTGAHAQMFPLPCSWLRWCPSLTCLQVEESSWLSDWGRLLYNYTFREGGACPHHSARGPGGRGAHAGGCSEVVSLPWGILQWFWHWQGINLIITKSGLRK